MSNAKKMRDLTNEAIEKLAMRSTEWILKNIEDNANDGFSSTTCTVSALQVDCIIDNLKERGFIVKESEIRGERMIMVSW